MEEVSMSIFMTTATSAFAFMLGCTTSIPSVRWLCLYAFPTILIDFIYQITFFVAIIVIDDSRRRSRRRDCLCCFTLKDGKTNKGSSNQGKDYIFEQPTQMRQNQLSPFPGEAPEGKKLDREPEEIQSTTETSLEFSKPLPKDNSEVLQNESSFEDEADLTPRGRGAHFSERVMVAYSDILLRPSVKIFVIWAFVGIFGACAYSATQLKVFFEYTSVLPRDSYLIDFDRALVRYTNIPPLEPYLYFRNIDHSKPEVLDKIDEYVTELVDRLDAATQLPFEYWLGDYRDFLDSSGEFISSLSFNETIHLFLNDERYQHHRENVAMDRSGEVVASRTQLAFDNLDANDVDQYLGAYRELVQVGSEQEVNQGEEWSVFATDPVFYLWAFLDVTESELFYTTIYGIFAVSVMSLLLIPHWSAVFIMTPLIFILYIDLLGFIRFFGLSLNGVTFVAMVMSIGLLVDFIMHVAHRYFETPQTNRVDKTKEVLRTMGASILLGGMSTFLGTVPLAFASNDIFHTIFVTFIGIVLLGVSHGLVLFPVLLSMFGPE